MSLPLSFSSRRDGKIRFFDELAASCKTAAIESLQRAYYNYASGR